MVRDLGWVWGRFFVLFCVFVVVVITVVTVFEFCQGGIRSGSIRAPVIISRPLGFLLVLGLGAHLAAFRAYSWPFALMDCLGFPGLNPDWLHAKKAS